MDRPTSRAGRRGALAAVSHRACRAGRHGHGGDNPARAIGRPDVAFGCTVVWRAWERRLCRVDGVAGYSRSPGGPSKGAAPEGNAHAQQA